MANLENRYNVAYGLCYCFAFILYWRKINLARKEQKLMVQYDLRSLKVFMCFFVLCYFWLSFCAFSGLLARFEVVL